jgi:hypothetical protein
LHAFNAFFSSPALTCAGVGFDFSGLLDTMLPAPKNVALDGAPKTEGCSNGAGLHDAADPHSSGRDDSDRAHGEPVVHSCASYTSTAVSTSVPTSCSRVVKNASPPVPLASRNVDGPAATPEEINPTQAPVAALNVALVELQFPTPAGSNSYTSKLPFVSCGTNPSLLFMNNRPLSNSDRE